MEPVDPTRVLAVQLEAQQWNLVLDVLMDGRYRIVAPLIQLIGTQLNQAAAVPHSGYPKEVKTHE